MKIQSVIVALFLLSCKSETKPAKTIEFYRFGFIKDLGEIVSLVHPKLKPETEFEPRRYYSFEKPSDALLQKDSTLLVDKVSDFYSVTKGICDHLLMHYDKTDLEELLTDSDQDENGAASYILSQAYLMQKDTAKAESCIDEAILRNPYIEAFYELKIKILDGRKAYHTVITQYDHILSFTGEKWTYHYQKFKIFRILKKRKEAVNNITNAIELLKGHNRKHPVKHPVSVIDHQDQDALLNRDRLGYYYLERAGLFFDLSQNEAGCTDLKNAKECSMEVVPELSSHCN